MLLLVLTAPILRLLPLAAASAPPNVTALDTFLTDLFRTVLIIEGICAVVAVAFKGTHSQAFRMLVGAVIATMIVALGTMAGTGQSMWSLIGLG